MARHFSKLNINAFRGICNLEIDDLGDINIIVGDNNCGKTSVLEAIQIVSDPTEYNIFKVGMLRTKFQNSFNADDLADAVTSILHRTIDENNGTIYSLEISADKDKINFLFDENKHKHIKIEGKPVKTLHKGQEQEALEINIINGKSAWDSTSITLTSQKKYQNETHEYSLNTRAYDYVPDINVKTVYTIDHILESEFPTIFNDKVNVEKAIRLLKEFDDTIIALRYISKNRVSVPVIDTKAQEAMPLTSFGDGMKKVLKMIDALISAEDGILLIDEYESAIHTSAMNEVYSFLINSCKKMNVQLFLTTHSIEAIDKFLASEEKELDNIRIITLKRKDEKTYARILNGRKAEELRNKNDAEVR